MYEIIMNNGKEANSRILYDLEENTRLKTVLTIDTSFKLVECHMYSQLGTAVSVVNIE